MVKGINALVGTRFAQGPSLSRDKRRVKSLPSILCSYALPPIPKETNDITLANAF